MNSLPSDPTQAAGTAVTTHTRVHDTAGISCGEFLRRARERRRLTLQQIAQSTKIPLRHLDALERDEFEALPSGMYRRAEVRAYADAVGLDSKRCAGLARSHVGTDDAEHRRLYRLPDVHEWPHTRSVDCCRHGRHGWRDRARDVGAPTGCR